MKSEISSFETGARFSSKINKTRIFLIPRISFSVKLPKKNGNVYNLCTDFSNDMLT